MAATVSIRHSMLVNLVVVIAVLSAGILATTVLAGHRAVRVLSASLISQSIHEAETKLDLFFGPVDDALRVTRSWGQQGMIDLDRPEFLNTLLSPLLIENPQVTSIVIADARGREHMLTRHEEGWSCRQSRPGQWGGQARWTEWGEGQVEPAEATGGDTFDVVGCKDAPAGGPIVLTTGRADRAFLLMADATGHGIGPALCVTQIRAMLRMAVRANQPLRSMVRHLNEQLVADLPEGRFITAWLAELDAASRLLTSFSAGQAPILRYDAARNVCDILPADTLPFGVVANLDVEVAQPIRVNAGDIIAVISDGIFEAVDASGAQFGDDRVVEAIKTNRTSSPSEIIEAIRTAVNAFTDGAPATDDRTGIVIKGL